MIVGCIYVIRNMEDYLSMSLSPWVAARAGNLGGCTYWICAVCVPFKGFPNEGPPDSTLAQLEEALVEDRIDHLITGNDPVPETEARGAALEWLTAVAKVDVLIQWDGDEVATEGDIISIMSYVRSNPFVNTFRVSYRNLVFDINHYLAEPFTPMRIHRVQAGGYRAAGFWDDNNVYYTSTKHQDHTKRDTDMACLTIPQCIAAPTHWSWLSTDRSRRKVQYQHAHFGHCGYRWDDAAGELRFDEAFYARQGLPLPEVLELPKAPSS